MSPGGLGDIPGVASPALVLPCPGDGLQWLSLRGEIPGFGDSLEWLGWGKRLFPDAVSFDWFYIKSGPVILDFICALFISTGLGCSCPCQAINPKFDPFPGGEAVRVGIQDLAGGRN